MLSYAVNTNKKNILGVEYPQSSPNEPSKYLTSGYFFTALRWLILTPNQLEN